jgi:Poly A polymerase regulatory subunit
MQRTIQYDKMPRLPYESKHTKLHTTSATGVEVISPVRANTLCDDSDNTSTMTPQTSDNKPGPLHVRHCGQLKLLLTCTEILTKQSKPGDIVVYTGNSTGSHLRLLATMFPLLDIHMYDTSTPFQTPHENVCTFARPFSDDDAASYYSGMDPENSNVLFMCDVRDLSHGSRKHVAVAKSNGHANSPYEIQTDLQRQQRWVQMMRPRVALLKFRQPYDQPKLLYLAGQMYIQPFAPSLSSECRLLVDAPSKYSDDYQMQEYDNAVHGDIMYHHNVVVRTRPCHTFPETNVSIGYDQCVGQHIIQEYMKAAVDSPAIYGIPTLESRKKYAASLMADLQHHYGAFLMLHLSDHPLMAELYRHVYEDAHTGSGEDDDNTL